MKLVEVGWMLNESAGIKYGQRFLQAVYNSGNEDLFYTDTIKITVEYLYSRQTKKILRWPLFIYVCTVALFIATLFYFESVED